MTDENLTIEIADNGIGGADPAGGLRPARDERPPRRARRHAVGLLPAGEGTRLVGVIPCAW